MKTPDFKQELDEVINCLREEGDILSGRAAMSRYCNDTPQSKMTKESYFYGVRVDTDKDAYLLRMNLNKGDYNLYCYCYVKEWLDNHMAKACLLYTSSGNGVNKTVTTKDDGTVDIELMRCV